MAPDIYRFLLLMVQNGRNILQKKKHFFFLQNITSQIETKVKQFSEVKVLYCFKRSKCPNFFVHKAMVSPSVVLTATCTSEQEKLLTFYELMCVRDLFDHAPTMMVFVNNLFKVSL